MSFVIAFSPHSVTISKYLPDQVQISLVSDYTFDANVTLYIDILNSISGEVMKTIQKVISIQALVRQNRNTSILFNY